MQVINPVYSEGDSVSSYHFFIRKLHSLLGVFPITLFLTEHLFTNLLALISPTQFNSAVNFLHSIPYLGLVEFLLIAVPLTVHALYGLYIMYIAENNITRYSYVRNWTFFLQRITALITFIFVVVHVWQLRISQILYGFEINYATIQNQLTDPLWLLFYIIGLVAAVFHFANGIWNFTVSWGIVVGENSQNIIWKLCMFIFILFTALGLSAVWAFIQ